MILCFQSEVAGTVSKETTIKSLSVSMGEIETRCLYIETTLQFSASHYKYSLLILMVFVQ